MKIRHKILLVMMLMVFLSAVSLAVLLIENQRSALLLGLDKKLFTAAHMVRKTLPDDFHDSIKNKQSISKKAYLKIVNRNNQLCTKLGMEYLWSLLQIGKNVYFTSGTATSKTISKGDFASFFQIHAKPQLYYDTFNSMNVTYQINDDKWGRIRVVLVPFIDKHGRKYLFGASKKTTEIDQILEKNVHQSIIICLLLFIPGIILSLLLSNSLSRPIERVTAAAGKIASGDLKEEINLHGSTELISLSKSINKMNKAIHEKIEQIKDREEKLRQTQKMDVIGQLAGGLAHDFNNILGGIIGSVEILASKISEDDDLQEYVSIISQSADRASDLTKKLLAFGRKGKYESKRIDVKIILHEALQILEHTFKKSIEMNTNVYDGSHFIKGDHTQIESIFINLGVNARDAMPDGGTLSFSTSSIGLDEDYCSNSIFDIKPGEYLDIEVRDTGKGIPLEDLPKIFEPFFSTKEVGKGTGLGLPSVYGIVKIHGGAVQVYSELNMGTIFHLYFPLMDHSNEITEKKDNRIIKGTGNILIIDDEEIIRKTTEYMLVSLGYSVSVACNAEEGIGIYRENHGKIDLVLLDMIMPGIHGVSCFHELKAINEEAKIIICSGFSKHKDVNGLQEAGLSGFLLKPFRKAELSQLLNAVLKE